MRELGRLVIHRTQQKDEEEAVAAVDEDGELTCAASEGDITEQDFQQLLPSSLKERLARISFDLTHSAPSQLNVDFGSVSGPNVFERGEGWALKELNIPAHALARLIETQQSSASVSSYVAALVDLWRQQVLLGINDYPNARSPQVSLLLGALAKTKQKRKEVTLKTKESVRGLFSVRCECNQEHGRITTVMSQTSS